MILEALFLGLSTGTYCVMYCAPVALPFFVSEEMNRQKNAVYVLLFMGGRLAGYILTGAILGLAGAYALKYIDPELQRTLTASGFFVVGILMLLSGLIHNFPGLKICSTLRKISRPGRNAIFLGFFTALNLCPPFFAAASRVFGANNGVLQGMEYFLFFYTGTSIFLLPLFGVHLFQKKIEAVRTVSRMILLLLGGYFTLILGLFEILRIK